MLVTELAEPLTIRRTVAVSTAIREGAVTIEGLVARRVSSTAEAVTAWQAGEVPVIVSPELPDVERDVVVDARLAKQPLDTTVNDAPFVVGLGPGFVVGRHCHAAVETNRGHHLGRTLWSGSPEPDTGTPGTVRGHASDRIVRAPVAGVVDWEVTIADQVTAGQRLGAVAGVELRAAFDGVVRGTIAPGNAVTAGMKIGDIDPRCDAAACFEISDKALAIGGGVVEAVSTWSRSR